jgi:anti-sigma regulatory factor (Ser/Thr protein kinase)
MELCRAEAEMDTPTRRIEFPMHAYAENVYLVRRLVDQGAAQWGLPKRIQHDARLVLTELASNATRLYPRQMLKTWIAYPETQVLELCVWDPDPFNVPVLKEPDYEAEKGRGLQLVAALSREWSWYPSETSGGKVVWARQVW